MNLLSMTNRIVSKYQLVDHGVDHEQYFQGCGIAHTEFETCYIGIGSNASEAIDDAIEQAVCGGDFEFTAEQLDELDTYVDSLPEENELTHTECSDEECYAEGMNYYVSIRIK